jgi:nucleoside-diphosphate-sugar epimerase
MKALVIGGTGPTGPHVLQGLIERGYEPVIFHRGVHEPEGLPAVRHIHADPHFAETIEEALRGEEFDLVMAMYGRVKAIATTMRSRCDQLVAVGGIPAYQGCLEPERFRPYGMAVPAHEAGPLADAPGPAPKFSALMLDAERTLFELASHGAFRASVVRYPCIHGPRNTIPMEWSVIKRVLDKRPHMILPDGGLGIFCRCAARNAAEVLLRIVDRPEISNGEAYNCADDDQFTWRQWVELITGMLGSSMEVVSLPEELATVTICELVSMPGMAPHTLLDMTKAREHLGYRDVINARDAIEQTVQWMLENPIIQSEFPAYQDQFDYASEDRLIESYAKAMLQVQEEAGRTMPELFHGLPHPKAPSVGRDERGR